MKILVTGAAGFIGFHLIEKLVQIPHYEIIGLDNLNDYYDTRLKYDRLKIAGIVSSEAQKENCLTKSTKYTNYQFVRTDLVDEEKLNHLFAKERFTHVVNLAAQAGVRYSIENPQAYVQSNLVGFVNILEACRHHQVKNLLYASSSSVYGGNEKVPFSEGDQVDHPVSLYAATKKSNELMAHTYSHLYGLNTIGLRFFTVYGPWGRPDMAPMLFTNAISKGEEIKIFNHGDMERDFTFISDIVDGITKLVALQDSGKNKYQIFNIGNSSPVKLMHFISTLESELGVKARKKYLPMQDGDVPRTYADTTALHHATGYQPKVKIEEGVALFVDWYKKYHQI
ncbi:NAD-dependent epimerase [Halosquirtibacter laminarini]|uniref:NAD-dependent epimerase n=1 Tax=Halosquirtibacter laminarini TaxID=3374600 RepID=A0AC61NQ12_9BACT|nr:NAD-dependent epimerase [Prolixibacteraceae bacterium]